MARLKVEKDAKEALNDGGWRKVGQQYDRKLDKLETLLDGLRVDSRRATHVEALEEARQIVRSL